MSSPELSVQRLGPVVADGGYHVAWREPVPDDVVLAELLAATQAAVNHSRELLSIARRLLVNVEGGPDVPVETRAEYWLRFAEMDAAHMRIQDTPDRWPFLRAGPSTVQWRPRCHVGVAKRRCPQALVALSSAAAADAQTRKLTEQVEARTQAAAALRGRRR
jgi:hypothetical protein